MVNILPIENIDLIVFGLLLAIGLIVKIVDTVKFFRERIPVLKSEIRHMLSLFSIVISIIALIIFIIGMLFPWFTIDVNYGDKYSNLISLDGWGIRSGFLDGQGFQVSFNLALLLMVVYNIFHIIGMESIRKYGFKVLREGLFTFLIIVLAYLFVVNMPQVIGLVEDYSKEDIPESIENISQIIASSPLNGQLTEETPLGEVTFIWYAGFGLYLFFASGILKIVAGILGILSSMVNKPKTAYTAANGKSSIQNLTKNKKSKVAP